MFIAKFPLWQEAILGSSLTIPTLEGTTQIRIPPNTHTHQLFRLTGRGLPDNNNQNCGDLHIRVIIELPQSLTVDQERLLQKNCKMSCFRIKHQNDKPSSNSHQKVDFLHRLFVWIK